MVHQSGLDVADTAWAPPDKIFPPSKLDVDPVLCRARESLHVVVDVYMGPLFPFHELPKELRQGARIAVVPVLVTQGINEMQTLANAAGHTNVQVDINASAARCLSRYVDICAMSRCLPTAAEAAQRVSGVLSLAEVQSRVEMFRTIAGTSRRKKTAKRPDKDVELLWVAEALSRGVRGGRVTSCKSAKDRTSMAVTLEQATAVAQRAEPLDTKGIDDVARVMRLVGVRRHNVAKNIGKPRYAFNALQVMNLPKRYRPPEGSGGARTS